MELSLCKVWMMQWYLLLLISVGNFCLPPLTEVTGQGQLQTSTTRPGTIDMKCLIGLSPEPFTAQEGPFSMWLIASSEPCFTVVASVWVAAVNLIGFPLTQTSCTLNLSGQQFTEQDRTVFSL